MPPTPLMVIFKIMQRFNTVADETNFSLVSVSNILLLLMLMINPRNLSDTGFVSVITHLVGTVITETTTQHTTAYNAYII